MNRSSVKADRTATFLCWIVAFAVTGTFFWILWDLLGHGFKGISWSFLTTQPRDAGRSGGISSVLVSTSLILGVCLGVAIPTGVGTAAFLSEWIPRKSRVGRWIRRSLDLLAAVPSIVFGLFGAVFFGEVLGFGFSILSGGLTLALMVLPILIRATEAGFRSASEELRLGGAALGLRRATILRHLLLPAASHGIVVGLVLGVGRALAETAALIFTSGYVTRMPSSLLDSGRSISVHIYDLAMNVPGGEANAYATAVVLILLLILINSLASWATQTWLGGRSLP